MANRMIQSQGVVYRSLVYALRPMNQDLNWNLQQKEVYLQELYYEHLLILLYLSV